MRLCALARRCYADGVYPTARLCDLDFQVSDIQAVYRTLSARGVSFVAAPHVVNRTPKSEVWLSEFKDPDGNQLALMAEVAIVGA